MRTSASGKLGQVVIEVRGGNVVSVYSDTRLRIRLLDWDNIGADSAKGPSDLEFGRPEPLLGWMKD